MENQRYKKTQHIGIRKCNTTGNFQAKIQLPGLRPVTKTFKKISEAIRWRKTYSGQGLSHQIEEAEGINFGEVWKRYVEEKLAYQAIGTRENRLELSKAFKLLLDLKMSSIDSACVSKLISRWKDLAVVEDNPRRQSFENELKLLKVIFNWYRDMYEPRLVNPVSRHHTKNCRIRPRKIKSKKMNEDEVKRLIAAFKADGGIWHDFFVVHLLCAGRVQEIAALQPSSILMNSDEILINKGMIWSKKTKKFLELSSTKTGEEKRSKLTKNLWAILKRRISEMPKGSEFIFNDDGLPLSYRQIQYRYNKALKRAGLSERFSATHFARHTMATFVRIETGSLDDVMSITGHKCRKVASGYANYTNERGFRAVEDIDERILGDVFSESVQECAEV